jgi:hypothetical protein
MSQRNKDLPAMPVHPMQDKFGQVILMAGMSKLEMTALNILCSNLNTYRNLEYVDISVDIERAYEWAEEFCAYLETKSEKESSIII